MKFSLSIAMQDPTHLVPLAKAAEDAGWDAISIPDSIFYSEAVSAKYPYTSDGSRMWNERTPFVEPFVAAAAMGAGTSTIRFQTSVVKLSVRDPVLVAKQVSSLAAVTNDRFTFGVGLGWLPEEFEWCGTVYETRGPRANEAIEILRLLLDSDGEMVAYEGKHYRFGKLTMSPLPKKRVPIWVGGHSKPGLRRAAKYGDGWTSAMLPAEKLLGFATELTRLRAEMGQDGPFDIQGVVTDVYDVDGFKRLEEGGVTDLIFVPWLFYGVPMDAPVEAKIDGVRRFADDFIAKMR